MGKAWVFGVDGGGTSCRLRVEAAVGDLLWKGESSGANPRSVGWEGVRKVLEGLFSALYEETDLEASDCAGGFAGMAGVGRVSDRDAMRGLVRATARVSCPVEADMDALPALVGALGAPDGILLVAGTGSVALGLAGSGDLVRAGGWGHILGDEGSAWDVGRKGLDAAIRAFEGRGPDTALLPHTLAYFGISDPFDLIPAVYENFDKSRVAGFARELSVAREDGDQVAEAILRQAAEDLVALVVSVASRLPGAPPGARLALSGGFVEKEPFLRRLVEERLAARLPGWEIVPTAGDAARGACELARRLAGPRA